MTTDDQMDQLPSQSQRRRRTAVFVAVTVLAFVLFFTAYGYASSRPDAEARCEIATSPAQAVSACSAGCCGSASEAPVVSGEAIVADDLQRIEVDVSKGYFDPGQIVLRAGIPAEIVFGEGQGCLAEVLIEDFGISEDLTSGGAVVSLPPLEPGTYGFSCGMRMVHGELVVR